MREMWLRIPGKARSLLLLLPSFVYVCIVHAMIPFKSVPFLGFILWASGFSNSIAKGEAWTTAMNFAMPVGALPAFGLPFNVVQASLISLFDLQVLDSYALSADLFLAAALAGCFLLARHLGGTRAISAIIAVLFLTLPLIKESDFFGPLGMSFALLPTYFLVALRSWDRFSESELSPRAVAGTTAMLVGTFVFALFLDGYGFAMFCFMSGFLTLWRGYDLLQRHEWRRLCAGATAFCVAVLIAVVLYYVSVASDGEMPVSDLSTFSSLSADVASIVMPTKGARAVYDWAGIVRSSSPWPNLGDSAVNFPGYLLLLVAGAGFVRGYWNSRLRHALLAAAVVALVFSIGPSFKFDARQVSTATAASGELMGTPLPTAVLFEKMPGLKNMRASSRWLLVVDVSLVLFALAALMALDRRYGSGVATIAGLLLLVEAAPSLSGSLRAGEKAYAQERLLKREVVDDLGKLLKPGEMVYFRSARSNFYLPRVAGSLFVTYAAADLGIHAYNVGGDKNLFWLQPRWPQELRSIRRGICVLPNLISMIDQGALDAVVFPFFDTYWSVFQWPRSDAEIERGRREFRDLRLQARGFSVVEMPTFAVARRARNAPDPGNIRPLGQRIQAINLETCEQTGWSDAIESVGIWTIAEKADLTLSFDQDIPAKGVIHAYVRAFTPSAHPEQRVAISVNGVEAGTWDFHVGDGMMERRIAIPAGGASAGGDKRRMDLSFTISAPMAPAELHLSPDARRLGMALSWICVTDGDRACDAQ